MDYSVTSSAKGEPLGGRMQSANSPSSRFQWHFKHIFSLCSPLYTWTTPSKCSWSVTSQRWPKNPVRWVTKPAVIFITNITG